MESVHEQPNWRTRSLHQWFELQADRTPEATAIIDGVSSVSFAQLEQQANRLAYWLNEQAVGTDDLVGVCLDRSAMLLVAMLGVLKAGAAYLPLASSLPQKRFDMMLREAHPKLLLCNGAFARVLPPAKTRHFILEDLFQSLPRQVPRPNFEVHRHHLAYAIFTSGSTGTPKLVGIEHASILLAFATEELFQPADVRCVPFMDLISFDSSLHQIFLPLSLGGTLVVVPDAVSLHEIARTHAFSCFGTTPSTLGMLLDEGLLPTSIGSLGLGAEIVPPKLVERLSRLEHVERVFNFYGPTEATVYCTVARLLDRMKASSSTLATRTAAYAGRIIGHPIPNARVYVVNESGQPVPPGTPGELWVAGTCVARGYLNSPSATAERFGLDPFKKDRMRLYRTGDLVRQLPDNNLEFLGRRDHQVKIRGFRIELGEVESVLRDCPGVSECVVVAREDELGDKRLVAYVAPAATRQEPAPEAPAGCRRVPESDDGTRRQDAGAPSDDAPDISTWRDLLKQQLPDYMIPSAFVLLDKLPLTPNGKIDREALLTPEMGRLKKSQEGVVPQPFFENSALPTEQMQPSFPDPRVTLSGSCGVPVVRQFLEMARANAGRPAIRQNDRDWTYHQLEGASRQIARQLVAANVKPGEVVAVSGRRSFGLIAGILGALAARGVILLVDASFPSARRDLMLEEARARHWVRVTDDHDEATNWSSTFRRLPTTAIASDGVCPTAPGDEQGAMEVVASAPGEPAYVFFTSGTTGKPKAILGSHQGLSHFIDWERQTLEVLPRDRVAQLTGLSFDVVLRDIFLPLTSGATLCLPEEEMVIQGDRLMPWLRAEGITILHAVPSLAGLWLDHLPPETHVPTLRWVLFAGESLSDRLVGQWRKQIGDAGGIINLYGPTETTLAKCYYVVPKNPAPGIQPVGWPLPFTQALVLNPANQLCASGEPGEIAIRTPFMSLGYLNGTEQDRGRFAPNPFRDDPSDLIYRTGDRGAYAPDGSLRILGRLDDQFKIHGARVEPGEICAVLDAYEGIRQSVVLARPTPVNGDCLVAYIVLDASQPAPEAQELRDYLSQKLPNYMIPSRFVAMPALPLTPNGKLDRRALEYLDGESTLPANQVQPRNRLESELTEIWQGVLRRERVGIHDNFFELGGHSLKAMQVVFRIRRSLGVEVQVRALFEHPTIAGLARHLARLQNQGLASVLPLAPGPREGRQPLSFAQQRLWFLHRLEGSSTAYHLSDAWHLRGEINREALERAINTIVARHESLRTSFVEAEGKPFQVIAPTLQIALPTEDLSQLHEAHRQQAIDAALRLERAAPFDLSLGPLLRAKLLKLREREHLLLQTCHHIVSDGWSRGVFEWELSKLYGAFCVGNENPLPPLPVQYADYAWWQREWLQGAELERQFTYWRKQLANPPTLELPTDRPRPNRQTRRGAIYGFVLSSELTARLQDFNRRENVTPFMSLLAAFQVLLSRYSGQEDVLVGTPMANRQQIEFERLIGFFVNTLVLRGDLSGKPGFREMVARVRRAALEAYEHQDLPFEKLVAELKPARELGRNPLFQVLFALQNAPGQPLSLGALDVSRQIVPLNSTPFDLELHIWQESESWRGSFSYATDLFETATIERMAGHYLKLLEEMLSEPERPVSAVPILTEGERHQMLVEWNTTTTDYPRDKCIHQLFEEQAETAFDAIAVVAEQQSLTYRQLNERANQLAHHLCRLGVKPGAFVGVHLERSVDLIVSQLAIVKAGAAYVPLATDYPLERLRFMVADCGSDVVLTLGPLPKQLEDCATTVVNLGADAEQIQACSKSNPAIQVSAKDLAYVMYTSGSTGQPKGVAIPHRGVIRLVRGQKYADFDTHQRFLLLANPSFDASTFELWGPLLNGAVCVVYSGHLMEFKSLEVFIRQHRVTCIWLTAGLFNRIIDIRPSVLESVRHVLTGGEALSVAHVQKALNLLPTLRLTNGYGPTESTTFACTYAIGPSAIFPAKSVPIGKPIANTRVYVLNRDGQLAPVGATGELCIGGDGLARGYINRPELTAEKFVFENLSSNSSVRLYRTGDLARHLPDGNIEFLGRMDQQVKIRGFRIEPGEVESSLRHCPGVRECFVMAREDKPGDRRLVAYMVGSDPRLESDGGKLRDFLKQKLPDYMVPSAFVMLEKLPLNPSGKIDRQALPAPEPDRARPGQKYVASRTPTEETLAGIWAEVLNLKAVGVHDDFFELGGHSLLAVIVQARVEKELRKRLPLAAIFKAPTVRELAKLLSEPGAASHGVHFPGCQASQDKPRLFCLHHLSAAQRLAKHLAPHWPVYGIESPLDNELRQWYTDRKLDLTLEELAGRNLAMIQRVQPIGPYFLAGFCFGGVVAFEVARQLQCKGERVALLALLDAAYLPGLKPLSLPGLRRWRYHAKRASTEGAGYVMKKMRKRLERDQRQRAALQVLQSRGREHERLELEVVRLLQTEFLGQILRAYRGKPYPGSALLLRTLGEPLSFAFELGATSGWSKIILGEVQVEDVQCSHLELAEEPWVGEVARKLVPHLHNNDPK